MWGSSGCAPRCFLITYRPFGSLCSLPRRHVQHCNAYLRDSESELLTQASRWLLWARQGRKGEEGWASCFVLRIYETRVELAFYGAVKHTNFKFIHARSWLLIFCCKMKKKTGLHEDVYKTWFPLPCYTNWSRHQHHTAGYFLEYFAKVKINNKYVLLQKNKLYFIGRCPVRV